MTTTPRFDRLAAAVQLADALLRDNPPRPVAWLVLRLRDAAWGALVREHLRNVAAAPPPAPQTAAPSGVTYVFNVGGALFRDGLPN